MNGNVALVSILLSISACALSPDEEAGDAEHERFVAEGGGKEDTGGIAEGTAQALGVLHVANTLTEAQLRSAVGLSTAAAANISAYKQGDDEVAGTADDEQYETLAELDSIPFVGPIAFGKLVTYAEAEGFTDDPPPVMGSDDPFDPEACAGAPLSQSAAKARWQTDQILGSYQLAIRNRSCPTSTTCGAWSAVDLGTISWRTKADGQLKLAKYGDTIMLQTVHGLCNQAGAYIAPIPQYVDGAVCSGVGHTLYCGAYTYPNQCIGGYSSENDDYELPNGLAFALEGKLTENCAQMHDTRATIWGNEYEVALLVRY
jgi:hypothetical protein